MSFNLFGARSAPNPSRVAEIKTWVAEAFALDDAVLVMVTELQCTEPGCPPIETVVALMGGPDGRQQFKLHSPIADVSFADIAALARADAVHHHDDHV